MLPKILIVYTGGTFGMSVSGASSRLTIPRLSPETLRRGFEKRVPELREIADCDVDVLMNRDSAHIGPAEWITIADRISERWLQYDGVVVLHGTDTLAYTASALSFLLRPCRRPVVITGAQRPLAALRSDARRNLVSAVEIASSGPRKTVSRVSVFFDDKLFVGSRVHKRSATEYHAFECPHAEPLAWVGTDIRYRALGQRKVASAKLEPRFNPRVALLHVTPGFPAKILAERLLPHLDGIVLNVFPSGTVPSHDPEFLEFLRTAKRKGLPVVVTAEGGSSDTPDTYEAGQALLAHGCEWAGTMTAECAFVKASLLLGQPGGAKRFHQLWSRVYSDEA